MKKIGIITFHDTDNYGAVLQAYALKTSIEKYEECHVINYYNKYFHKDVKRGLGQKIKNSFFARKYKKKKEGFRKFREKYLTYNNPWIMEKDLYELNDLYDLFIAGSDQVWNITCSGGSDAFFLPFVTDNKKKASYAASFGTNIPYLDEKYIEYIKKFNFISVREKSGERFLKKRGIDCIKVIDPVFLIPKEQWYMFTKKSEQKYILVYEVVNGKNMRIFAKNLSESVGLPVHFITSSNRPQFGVKTIRDAEPWKWLSEIRNAQYVITNSFHGLAFSMIFNIQFYVELLQNSDTNARMIELMETMQVSGRLISDTKNKAIDFSMINQLIVNERRKADKYLRNIIGVNQNDK